MSKILFIVSNPLEINTSASIRNKAMIEGLLLNGHTVDLVTTAPNPQHIAYDESLAVQGIHVTQISMNSRQKLSGMGGKNRLFLRLKSFVYRWITSHTVYDPLKGFASHTDSVNLSKGGYDYIISSSDPKSSHLFALRLLEQQHGDVGGKWIQIWGDPFLTDITQISKKRNIIKAEEQRLLQAADFVFYVSKPTLIQQMQLYPDCAHKMNYTPIPYLCEKVTENQRLSKTGKTKLAYCGDYSPSIRNLFPLYDAVNSANGFLELSICGGSSSPLQSTSSVHVMNRVPYCETRKIEDESDILVFVANRSGTQIPGKVYQYAGTNKPILFILDGDAALLKAQFSQYERFVFVGNSRADILNGIESIVHSEKTYSPLREFAKDYVMSEFMRKIS